MKDLIIDIIIKITNYTNLKENIEIDLIQNEILDSLAFIELITELETYSICFPSGSTIG